VDLKFIRIKDLKDIEGLSHDNLHRRFFEEQERIPMEIDDAELFKLQQELKDGGNPLVDEALEKVGADSEKLQETLDRQYQKRRELLEERSILTAETARRRAAAKAAIKKIDGVKLNMKDDAGLKKARFDAEKTVSRIDANLQILTARDYSHDIVSKRRRHLQRLMGCNLSDAEKYENELGSAMLRASRAYEFSTDRKRQEGLRDGKVSPKTEHLGYAVRGVHVNSIATPLEETNYWGDDGRIMGYMTLMEQMPEIIRLIRRGMSVSEILGDGGLREKASRLISQESPVTLARIGEYKIDDRYQVLDIESQRRVVAARLFGAGVVPARVGTVLE
jgi:plasmid maintenance system antidote protein VapI